MQEELRCDKCNSSQTRFRIKTNDRICYICGHSWKLEDKKEEEVEEEGFIDG